MITLSTMLDNVNYQIIYHFWNWKIRLREIISTKKKFHIRKKGTWRRTWTRYQNLNFIKIFKSLVNFVLFFINQKLIYWKSIAMLSLIPWTRVLPECERVKNISGLQAEIFKKHFRNMFCRNNLSIIIKCKLKKWTIWPLH